MSFTVTRKRDAPAKNMRPESPPVGVFAKTESIARSLIKELNITRGVPLSPRISGRGQELGAILVEESQWPLKPDLKKELAPALVYHGGYFYRLTREDPW